MAFMMPVLKDNYEIVPLAKDYPRRFSKQLTKPKSHSVAVPKKPSPKLNRHYSKSVSAVDNHQVVQEETDRNCDRLTTTPDQFANNDRNAVLNKRILKTDSVTPADPVTTKKSSVWSSVFRLRTKSASGKSTR